MYIIRLDWPRNLRLIFMRHTHRTSLLAQQVKNPSAHRTLRDEGLISRPGKSLGKETAAHSSIFTWKIPWREKSGGLWYKGLQGVGHNWATKHVHLWVFNNVFPWLSEMLAFRDSLVAQMVKNPPAMQKTWVRGLGRSLGGGHGNPLQCSCLENPMDRRVWRATIHGVAQNWTPLSNKEAAAMLAFYGELGGDPLLPFSGLACGKLTALFLF